jgi:hypothetical protein
MKLSLVIFQYNNISSVGFTAAEHDLFQQSLLAVGDAQCILTGSPLHPFGLVWKYIFQERL